MVTWQVSMAHDAHCLNPENPVKRSPSLLLAALLAGAACGDSAKAPRGPATHSDSGAVAPIQRLLAGASHPALSSHELEKYGDTEWAAEAKKRLGEMK